MGKNWMRERRQDHYYRMAKKEGYRSRASYKLKQINEKFQLLGPGHHVIELGSSPGGWTQIIYEIVGPKGVVVAVDIASMVKVEGCTFIKGDALAVETKERVKAALDDGKVNAIISDMSPNLSGHYSMDQARSVELAEMTLEYSTEFLRPGGNVIIKVFQGEDFPEFLGKVKDRFGYVKVHSPKASRKSSSEVYVVGKGFNGHE